MSKIHYSIKVILMTVICAGFVSAADVEDIAGSKLAKLRNTLEGTKQLIIELSTALKENPKSYDASWQYAAICYFYGDFYLKDKEAKKKYFTLCKDAAWQATQINPKGIDGHYWLGVGFGMWSEANGILDSLFYADDVASEMTKVIELDPSYFRGTPWMVRAKVYTYAPGWPLSVGDSEKAKADMKMALKYGSDYRVVYVLYSDILMHWGQWDEAMKMIDKGLALPFDKTIPVEEERSLEQLNEYKKKVSAELAKK
ncbi:MAG: hypothetical protein A2Y33_12000 [Spirochaetes bacterium GWF1_51_8]|nr:MAG: hypothetical protein A2Y33_12000 [Spirochaetes bacterium GWF1_51_8]